MARTPTPLEALALVGELSQWWALGELTSRANIQGGRELQADSTAMLADFADDLGVDPAGFELVAGDTGTIEAGQIGGRLLNLGSRAWNALKRNGRALVDTAAKNQGLVLTFGAVYTAHDFLTADKQIAIEQIRENGEGLRGAWNDATPTERAAITKAWLDQTGTGIGLGTVALGALALGGAWLALRWWEGRR